MLGDFHARDPNKLGIRTRYLSKHKNSELNKQNIWFVKTGQRQNQNYTSRDPDAAFEVWSEKNHTHTRCLLFELFFRQVDFPSIFCLNPLWKIITNTKKYRKDKGLFNLIKKRPISPIHMRTMTQNCAFFPNRPLGLVPVESKRSADFSNGAMRIDGPPVRFLVGRNCCLQPGVYLQTKRKKNSGS